MLWSRLRGRKIDEAGFGSEKAEIVLSRDVQGWPSNVSRGALFYGDLVNGKDVLGWQSLLKWQKAELTKLVFVSDR